MHIIATEDQARRIAATAVNASTCPGGMALFNHKPGQVYQPKDMPEHLNIDYFHGRMVKLALKPDGDSRWKVGRGYGPDPEYQSWADTYPTISALVLAAVPDGSAKVVE